MIKNMKWANAEQTVINCEINHPDYGWIPFTASPNDPEEHGRNIHAACLAGEHGAVAAYAPPPPPPAVIPAEVTMRQARLALLSIGKLSDVDAALVSITDPAQRQAAQIEWEYSSAVKRDSAWVQQLAPALGLDAAALDALFTAAAAL